jgi:hypothetical protein
MKRNQSRKKRQKPKSRRHQNARAKSRPRLITGVDLTEDQAGSDKSTQSGDTQGPSDDPGALLRASKS